MANLTGGKYITFAKPYLELVADIIKTPGKKLKFDGNIEQVINQTDDIGAFLQAVSSRNEAAVDKSLKIAGKFLPIFNGYPWTKIDKSQFTKQKGSDGASTAMQERASLHAIQAGIEKNGYRDRDSFFRDNRQELLKLYPDMDEEWEETFYQQQVTIVRELGPSRFTHYSRDGGFMDFISKFVKDKYNINKKDNWDPADVWLVNDLNGVTRTLTSKIKDDVTPIQEFNAILRDMFHEKKVIGISLKKMSGPVAKWELVNVGQDMFDDDEYAFSMDSAVCNMSLMNTSKFKTADSRINISTGNGKKITFQIKQNSAGISNLKIEGTDLSAKSARLGKAPLDMVANLFKSANLSFDNRNQNFPTTAAEFTSAQSQYVAIFRRIRSITNVTNEIDFVKNMLAVFESDRPDFAHSKCMQMKVMDSILSLTDNKRDELLTSLAFLCQKKGDVFGPFGKLY